MLTTEQRLKQLKTYFQSQKYVSVAYLFGSVAKGLVGPMSDVDVAVILGSNPDSWHEHKMRLIEGLGWIFSVPYVDVTILNKADPVLAHRVIYEGQPIFVRDEAVRARFEERVLKEYLDTGFLRRVHRASIKEQLSQGDYFG